VHALAERLLSHIRRDELLKAGDRVGVAVSGGIDSVALLRILLELRGELGIVLSTIHFNHQLRGAESDADEEFVARLARDHGLEFYCDRGNVQQHAAEAHISIEAAARELRYAFFRRLLGEQNSEHWTAPATLKSPALSKIVTGHTLDDQAETVLLRVIRGAGLRGIAGIHPRIVVESDDGEICGEIVRPFLSTRRRELESYLRKIGQSWREDATNASTKFTRNRVRKLLVPMLEKEFNPSVTENLSELAAIARGEEDYWENEIAGWMGTGVHWVEPAWVPKRDLVQIGSAGRANAFPESSARRDLEAKIETARWLVMNASLDRLWFLSEPLAVQRRIIKAIGDHAGVPLEFKHVEEIVRFSVAETESGSQISLPLGWNVQWHRDEVLFVTPDLREPAPPQDYEYELRVPGEVNIAEIGCSIEVRRVSAGMESGYNPEHLLDEDSLPGALIVRNWRAGDRFWPNHTKAPKKVKELLHERHVPLPERRLWPVVLAGAEIVWMRGFPPPARFAIKPGREAVAILERPTGSEG
jgi:tRNA(Ile)-lysidine synthase